MNMKMKPLVPGGRLFPAAVLLVVGLAGSGCVTVQPASPTAELPPRVETAELSTPINLSVAVRAALRNDPQLRAARRWISVEYWKKYQESLPPNPTLTLSADTTEWIVKISGELLSLVDLTGARQRRVDATQSREEQAVLEVERRQIALTKEVRTAFAEVLSNRRIESLLQERVTRLDTAVGLAREQQSAGDLSEIEVIAFESPLREAQVDLADAALEARQWEARLNRLLVRPLESPASLEDSFLLRDPLESTTPGQIAQLGLANRPEIKVVAARIREHKALLGFAEVAWIPRIDGGPFVRRPGRGEDVVAGGSVSLTLPLFDRGQGLQGIEEATVQALEEELLAAEAGVLLDVHAAVLDLRRANERYGHDFPQQLDLARRARTIAEQSKDAGGASDIEVSRARVREIDAEVRLTRARRELWKAQVSLAAALGDPGDEEPKER